jgi:hypothetical protein
MFTEYAFFNTECKVNGRHGGITTIFNPNTIKLGLVEENFRYQIIKTDR